MKKISLILLVLRFIFPFQNTFAQNISVESKLKIDSLKKELALTKYDSAKVRLSYCIGQVVFITRIGYWDSVVSDAHKYHVPLFEGRASNALGYVCRLQNVDEKAIISLNRSYEIAKKIGNKPGMIPPLLNLSSFYLVRSNVKKSLDYCFRALKIAEEIKDKNKIATLYSEIGLCYFSSGEINKALKIHLKCLEVCKEMKDDERTAITLMDIGTDYSEIPDQSKSIAYYMETKKYTDKFNENITSVRVNTSIGSAYQELGQIDSAFKYSSKAYKIAEKLNSANAIISTMASLAGINFKKGDLKTSKKLALEAIEMSKSVNFSMQIPSLAELLKNIYIQENNYKDALKFYELSVAVRDTISNEGIRKQALEKEFTYDLEKKENENKLLTQQNQIQLLEIRQNKYFLAGSVGLLLLIIIITFLFFRQNKLRNEQQSAQLEQKLLLSQMNPHFIFNSLQAIQNFILKHNEKEAVKYLSSFASVTRNVLENSRMEVIPLKKEIALLENYLQLQKLRFKNRFDYEIIVDESIDIENMKIPPMLSQPFIENAVEHGFHNIEGEGKITVSYAIKNNALEMEIIDNGNGMKNEYSQNKQHQSLALEITKERVALMSKKIKNKVLFIMSEAFPFEKERKGVKVNFRLPLAMLS